jgi:hypothetical protein
MSFKDGVSGTLDIRSDPVGEESEVNVVERRGALGSGVAGTDELVPASFSRCGDGARGGVAPLSMCSVISAYGRYEVKNFYEQRNRARLGRRTYR